MITAKQGASLAELRRLVGSGTPIQFDQGKFAMTVDMLCAVGTLKLPVELPDHPSTHSASAWYIWGETRMKNGEDWEWRTAVAAARFNSQGEMAHALIFVVSDEQESTDFDAGLMLNDALRGIMASATAHQG